MRTTNERLEDLEAKVAKLERDQLSGIGAAYWAAEAVLQALHENRRIQYVDRKVGREAIEAALTDALAHNPELLDRLKLLVFRQRWRREQD